jgi:hypothetical protein
LARLRRPGGAKIDRGFFDLAEARRPTAPAKRKAPRSRGAWKGFLSVGDNSTNASVTGGCVDLVAITLRRLTAFKGERCAASNTETGNENQPSLSR